MCGIAGFLNVAIAPPAEPRRLLARMVAQIRTRGPDGDGYYADEHVGLGHARLSIIDLETGRQPVHNEDRTVWTIFNGEIFNYIELRRDLEKRGHTFYTNSDTEVLVHLYEEHGEDFVHQLNGQFAIALWDSEQRRLLLVRDRPGILPLFYGFFDGRLVFASEVKAMFPVMPTSPSLDARALDQLMTFWAPVSPATVFEGVREVPPGHLIEVRDGVIRERAYWDWTFPLPGEHRIDDEDRLVEELHELLVDATRIRLRADVPVGAYLSGGLDSSGIAALVDRYGDAPLRTFSLTFEDQEVDETGHQAHVLESLRTSHSSVHCTDRAIADAFPCAVWRTEAPVLRTAPVPMALLSGLVHDMSYKVVLTGEGADEVLGGYDLFKEAKIRQFWAKHPDSAFRASLLKRLYPYLALHQRQSASYLREFFGQAIHEPDALGFSHLPRWTTTARIKTFFSDDFAAALTDDAIETQLGRLPEAARSWHPFNRAQYIEAKTLMSGYLLCSQGDRMLMANSVEGRFPFLDHRLIEFANKIDPRLKMKVLNEKYLLKRALKPYLPARTVARHKQPYRAPDIRAFLSDSKMPEYVMEQLGPAAIRRAGYFDADRVARLLRKIHAGKAIGFKDNMAFVGLLSTQLWHHHFIERFDVNRGYPLTSASATPEEP